MYRSTAKRVKRASVWAATAALSVGAGVAAANIASVGPSLSAAPTTIVTTPAATATTTPIATTATTPSASSAGVQTAALTTSVAPTPRTVLAVTAHSLTVRGTTGAITYSVTPSTIVLSGTSHVSVTSIHVGSRVIVVPAATSPSVAGTIGILPSTGSGEGGGESNSRGFDN
jgi:hypothetical protein